MPKNTPEEIVETWGKSVMEDDAMKNQSDPQVIGLGHDAINRPKWYYNDGKATQGPFEYAEEHNLDVAQHAVVKYVTRAGRKPGSTALKDYKQARFYLEALIAKAEEVDKGTLFVDVVSGGLLFRAASGVMERERRTNPPDRRKCQRQPQTQFRRIGVGRRFNDITFDFHPVCSARCKVCGITLDDAEVRFFKDVCVSCIRNGVRL